MGGVMDKGWINAKIVTPDEFVNLLSFYVAYESENKKCWRIFTTMHDLDSATGLKAWIEEKESEEGCEIYPTFWKLLKT